ncbi:hemerythrin domain-containing protein [Mycobacterium angelicum]|uniref:Cation-binding protein n=1 Tax=Mycobacterium angelicum TaxID=470074 RepID=A0A1X0A5L4_MYCAN|nr:hemerythrin domain-containing protein [Mycobacterium angelicum]MCV7197127.1 hemerythrin domain-containing protein [Mycobacterium angelicum]ORA25361.1 cation-binding protein [Mycobacterium angelicum]
MDAIELLNHDHRMVEQLFRDYEAAKTDDQRRGVVEIAIRELSKHAALEELMVYPLAKQALSDGEQEIGHHLDEHMVVKHTLLALDKAGDDQDQTRNLMAALQKEIDEHVQDEEEQLWPKLREAVDQQTLDELGQVLDEAKKVAPTRPHPKAPTEPPALALAAPVAALYDRVRDRFQKRPQT